MTPLTLPSSDPGVLGGLWNDNGTIRINLMSAVTGGFGRPLTLGIEHWQPTPKWHWRYWIGHRMRRLESNEYGLHYEADWQYRTFKQHAHQVLRETYDDRVTLNFTATEVEQRLNYKSPNYFHP